LLAGGVAGEPDESPCQVTKALDKQVKADLKMAEDDSVIDTVILSGAAETEHHEIAVHESLIAQADELGKSEITQLPRQNLEIEQHTLGEVKQQQRKLASTTAA
jgi:ferritin-like metal-binding protein YciE